LSIPIEPYAVRCLLSARSGSFRGGPRHAAAVRLCRVFVGSARRYASAVAPVRATAPRERGTGLAGRAEKRT